VEIGTEAAQFPENEHINGILVAVLLKQCRPIEHSPLHLGWGGGFPNIS
jgi:hypothetical protein